MDLDGTMRLSLYSNPGSERTTLVSDLRVEYIFTDSEIITPIYSDFVSEIDSFLNSNSA